MTLPIAARAQQKPMPVIGYFGSRSLEVETPLRTGFLEGLQQAGFIADRDVAIEYRYADGNLERLPSLAAELVARPVALLVATDAVTAVAAKKATSSIPIVFGSGADPVALGLAASLSRPGGNATGMAMFTTELGPKRLEMMRELLPEPRLIVALFGPTTPTTQQQIREMEAAAQALRQSILVLQARDEDEVETAFATMAERHASGLVYGASVYFQGITAKLVGLAARYRLPALYEWPQFVAAGGLMSYSTSRREFGRIAGDYAGRILKGVAPGDLPVAQATRFELVINLKTAKALGISVPQSLLAGADEVIE
jgi:putative ABC transport system substrate-binding protein